MAAKIYIHAFRGGGSDLSQKNKELLISKFKKSIKLKNEIFKYIKKNLKKGEFDTGDISINFGENIQSKIDRDLYLSVQKVELRIWGKRASKYNKGGKKWVISLMLWDEYNFDNIRTIDKNGLNISVGNLGNDLGYICQRLNLIQPYKWWVSYEYTLIYS